MILASASPQRRAILTQLGIAFEARPAGVEELTQGDPHEVALRNAVAKAEAVAGDLVLGVDTVVALDGRIFGKPADAGEARATLRVLAGRTHEVISGLALRGRSGSEQGTAVTQVTFRDLSDAVIDRYVTTGEWQGRAGGYAIQERGAALVRRIDGDYLNVVGLPVALLLDLAPDLLH